MLTHENVVATIAAYGLQNGEEHENFISQQENVYLSYLPLARIWIFQECSYDLRYDGTNFVLESVYRGRNGGNV